MAGTVLTPPPGYAGKNPELGGSPSDYNQLRLSFSIYRLSMHVQQGIQCDKDDLFNTCLSLSRGIDYAVANNEVPVLVENMALLLKEVMSLICQRKSETQLQAALMVMMISVKNACRAGWFSKNNTEELTGVSNEIGRVYCSMGYANTGPSICHPSIPIIMERFYPQMKLGQILTSLKIEPGYRALAIDFHIAKHTVHSPQEKIYLFVTQTDNIETSSCIISPQQVNFLLNGKGVVKRTNVGMDSGPQMPTNVTQMLKYGTNLLQAVGQFNGNHIVLVAFMSTKSSPDAPILEDYVQPAVTVIDTDFEVIEGPSRISLNCPISLGRIKTPVKGRSCKHLQCFDFDNFVNINSRRPSWRCPHCNQHVCYSDIRMDKNMVEVLREVSKDVAEVIILENGSWKAVLENDDNNTDDIHNRTSNAEKEQTRPLELNSSSSKCSNVLDLTESDDQMDMDACEPEDRKLFTSNLQSQAAKENVLPDDFWSGVHLSDLPVTSSGRSNSATVGGISSANLFQSPVLADAISPALNQEANTNFTSSLLQNHLTIPSSQQFQPPNLVVNNEYGRAPSMLRFVSRIPIAIQALPAQTRPQIPQQRLRNSFNPLTTGSYSLASLVSSPSQVVLDSSNALLNNTERHQNLSQPHINPLQSQAPQVSVPAPSQLSSACRTSSGLFNNFQNSQLQQVFSQRAQQSSSQPPSNTPLSPHPQWLQMQQSAAQVGIGHTVVTTSSQHARVISSVQMVRQPPPAPVQNQASRIPSSFPTDSVRATAGELGSNTTGTPESEGLNLEQNWQPTGRMRGSLSGRPYPASLSHLIIQPTQSAQNARVHSAPSGAPSQVQLQALIANNRGIHNPETRNTQP